jgi:predicted nucleotidyltransferase
MLHNLAYLVPAPATSSTVQIMPIAANALLTPDDLERIVGAIRSEFDPAAIILFGSYARGDVRPSSDLDLLVVRKEDFGPGESRREEIGKLYRVVSNVCEVPKDILLFTRDEFLSWKNTTNHMLAVASREGKVLYGEV